MTFISGHLHAGNIIVEGGACQLLELENWFLGLPSYYRAFFTQHKKINVSYECEADRVLQIKT